MINRGTESRAARCFASRHRAAMPRHPHIPIRGGRLRAPQPCARQGAPAGQSGDDEAAVMAEAASKQLPPSRHCQGCACMLPACGSAWPSRTFSPPAAGPSRKLRDKSSRKREASPVIRSDRQDPAGQDQARQAGVRRLKQAGGMALSDQRTGPDRPAATPVISAASKQGCATVRWHCDLPFCASCHNHPHQPVLFAAVARCRYRIGQRL